MKLNTTLLTILFLFFQIAFGQTKEAKQISGKILAESTSVEAVNVINNTTQRTTVSDANGLFSIVVNEGDVLIFSAVNLESLRKKITKQDLLLDVVKVQMTAKSIDLKEVIINEHPEITAENIGVIPYGQKKYTPAERKLYTAGDFKPIHLLGLLGGTLAVDPIINKINGKSKKLKKEIEVEKKESYLKQLDNLFDLDFFVKELKIPSEHVKGFEYYIVDNEKFTTILKSNNKTMTSFLISELAIKYNEIIASENK
ncbi:MAG: carboxypeptidase-like regulatory domain-containing protein [Flavobacterium sp.]|nr:carboxypeptidase-like regulatory domain-containing protein [Flavobacterium sp.]